ncbi:ABC transporter substrate-binding protein [Longimicrobium sp.]|uniref:ABC transporter substrate-binding protein n=1 Tax=Longimicrobium sp. TaxID=2029185 RepID=UPI002E307347|nr:ABC transporter substrate-binding protein [Longimicrobium sp.]HEX6042126.1 ABC transporter substrate-binding protein [Longimicrobium sp.]
MVLALAAALAACDRGGGGKVYIGVAGPLGAANGVSMKRAAEMAAAEINAAGGIRGDSVELVFGDDGADPQKAIQVASTLKGDPRVVAVIGHVNSSASLRAATIYNADDDAGSPVVQISPASSAPALRQAGPWTFRVTPTDLEFSPALAKYARGLNLRRAAVLYANDDYGQGVMATFERAFRGGGGAVVAADPYIPAVLERGTELDPYLVRAMGRGADALIIGGQATEGVKIIQAARRLGYTGPILGSDGLTGAKDAGAVAEGVFVSSAFLPDRPDATAQRFVEAYRKRYQSLPDHRGAMTYDIMYLLRDAIREAGTDRQAIRDYVARIGAEGGVRAFNGVSGPIQFDTAGDVRGKPVTVGVVRGGQLVTARR